MPTELMLALAAAGLFLLTRKTGTTTAAPAPAASGGTTTSAGDLLRQAFSINPVSASTPALTTTSAAPAATPAPAPAPASTSTTTSTPSGFAGVQNMPAREWNGPTTPSTINVGANRDTAESRAARAASVAAIRQQMATHGTHFWVSGG